MNIVCLCTALPAESRPLIEHFKLSLRETRGIRYYSGDSVCLVETGIGKLKAAAAVAASLQNDYRIDALVNVGIAGGTADVGTRYLANSVIDKATERHWYPHLPNAKMLPEMNTIAIHTLDAPSRDYQNDAAFDMEASGVLTAASIYLDNTRIQCIKSISDNPSKDIAEITKESVTELITEVIGPVSTLIDHFQSNPTSETESHQAIELLIKDLASRIRISVSDTHGIKRLLQRHLALSDTLPLGSELAELQNAREVKSSLQHKIDNIGTRY